MCRLVNVQMGWLYPGLDRISKHLHIHTFANLHIKITIFAQWIQ